MKYFHNTCENKGFTYLHSSRESIFTLEFVQKKTTSMKFLSSTNDTLPIIQLIMISINGNINFAMISLFLCYCFFVLKQREKL